jgi:hypothetical protein
MSPEDISENFGESQLKIMSLLNIIDNEINSCFTQQRCYRYLYGIYFDLLIIDFM